MMLTTRNGHGHDVAIQVATVCGSDEMHFAAGSGAGDALALLRRIVQFSDGARSGLDTLDVSHVDRLLAAVYTILYGDAAECRLTCAQCRTGFEFTLSLAELIRVQDAERPGPTGPDGYWRLADGQRVRPPTLGDIAATTQSSGLLERLTDVGIVSDADAVAGWLETAVPVLSIDLDAPCPNCRHAAAVRFDIAAYLAARLAGERPFLLREIHLIAARYGWSRTEILSLGRDERRAYATMIEGERAAGMRLARRSA
jgi:hypothetical protein